MESRCRAGTATQLDRPTFVTNSQYAEFVNIKDPTGANTLGLRDSIMAGLGGIPALASQKSRVSLGQWSAPCRPFESG
jgi:hypothetical protein